MEQNVQGAQPKSGKKKIGCWIAGCLTALIVAVFFIASIVGIAFWATKGPVKVVQEQLYCLRKGDIEGAYGFTSGDFRKATSLEQFKKFISDNPSLAQNKSASFTSRKIENDRGYVEGTLTAIDGSKTPVKYELIKENNVWKILYIEVSQKGIKPPPEPVKEPALSGATDIEKIEVGTQRAPDGSIADAGDKFPEGTGEIKVSAYLSGAKTGQWVSAVWYFAEQPITDPVINKVSEDGDIICKFYISPPDNGWPTGRYKIIIAVDRDKATEEVYYSIGL